MSKQSRDINIGILGFGTVGGGVIQVIEENHALIRRVLGSSIIVKRVADIDLERERHVKVARNKLTTDPKEVISDPQIDIIVETIGGIRPSLDLVLGAIRSGKGVVTSNKELLAKHGLLILKEAENHGVDFMFEGAVGGGIPIIKILRESLTGDIIRELMGIINGTTNFILSEMTTRRRDLDDILCEAKRRGYAEANPKDDLEGYDSAHKLAILSSLAFHAPVGLKNIYREGISKITAKDMEYADELGYKIKLLAIAKILSENEMDVRVHPALLRKEHPLAGVDGVENAIHIKTDRRTITVQGEGAGPRPTGAALVSDIIDIARNLKNTKGIRIGKVVGKKMKVRGINDIVLRYYLRLQAVDRPGVMAKIGGTLGKHNVSISSIIQKEVREEGEASIVMMTHETKGNDFQEALAEISRLKIVKEEPMLIRVEE